MIHRLEPDEVENWRLYPVTQHLKAGRPYPNLIDNMRAARKRK